VLPYFYFNANKCENLVENLFFTNSKSENEIKQAWTKEYNEEWAIKAIPYGLDFLQDPYSDKESLFYKYNCPKCVFYNNKITILNYIYRLRFTLTTTEDEHTLSCYIENKDLIRLFNCADAKQFAYFENVQNQVEKRLAHLLKQKEIFYI
jgi:hypothetical protein